MSTSSGIGRLAIVVCVMLPILTGCIEFEEQRLSYHYDRATDTLRIHQVYLGIAGGKNPDAAAGATPVLSKEEQDQLRSVWTNERTFFFSNWLFELSLPQLRQHLSEPLAGDAPVVEREPYERLRALMQLVLPNTRVSNGPFFRDEQGRLSGVQRVTITKITAVIAAANDALRAGFAREAVVAGASAESRELYTRAAADPLPFVALAGNQITVRIPALREDYESDTLGPDGQPTPMVRAFIKAGGSIAFTGGIVTLTAGRVDSARETLVGPGDADHSTGNADEFVRDNFGIAEKFDPAADEKLFFAPPAKPDHEF